MDFITVIRNDEPITISVANIISFRDEGGKTRIAMTNQEFIYTSEPVSDKIKKCLRMKGHDIFNLESIK